MSTKSTLILTSENEHWYHDCNGRYYEDTKTEECFVLEFDPKHRVETEDDGTRIIIEEGTALFEQLMNIQYPNRKKGVVIDQEQDPEPKKTLENAPGSI